MTTFKAFIKSHPVLTYSTLTFAISWGGILLVIGPGGILGTREVPEELMPFVYLATLLGPSVAGILLTGLVDGKAGLGEFVTRLRRWRVGARWYVVVLLTAPLLITAALYVLSLTSSTFLPAIVTADDKVSLLLIGIVMGIMVGFFEELGWTGFAVPRLRKRYGVFTTGLIVGLVWGAWHFPLFSGSTSSSGALPPALYLFVLLFSFLPAYRVLMVWVYDRTQSLLAAILMHAPLAASQLTLIPSALSAEQVVTYDLIFAATLWVFVAMVAVANRGQLKKTTTAGGQEAGARQKERYGSRKVLDL
jgi:membrane protease YdiL (CAAX protease family)